MNQKQMAEDLFLNTEKTQTQIAAELGISPRTLYRWIQQGRWQQLRSATRRMPSVLVENIYLQLDDINYSIAQRDKGQRHPTKDESLTISRLMNSIGKVKKETSEGQNIEFLMNLINYVQPKNDDLAKTLTEYGSAFLKDTNPKGFHPYDIEYDNTPPSAEEAPPLFLGEACPELVSGVPEGGRAQLAPDYNPAQLEIPFPLPSLRGTKQSHDNTETVNVNELELPVLSSAVTLSFGEGRGEANFPNTVTLSLEEGWAEVSPSPIGHNSDIPPTSENPPQPSEDQAQEPTDNTNKMSENNFPHDRAQQEAPPLFLGELPEGGRAQLAPEEIPPLTANSPAHSAGGDLPQTTNVVSEQGDAGTISDARQANEHSVPAKEPPIVNKPARDSKFVYPGSGVHYLRKPAGPIPPLSKEDYDALFRPGEYKKKRRNDKW